MAKKQSNDNAPTGKKQKQTRMEGKEFERPNRIKDLDEAAEAYRKARDKRMAATKVETEKKSALKALMKQLGLKTSYFYDDDEGDTEEVKPVLPDPDDFDVKVNKVRQAKAKSDE